MRISEQGYKKRKRKSILIDYEQVKKNINGKDLEIEMNGFKENS